MRSGGGSVSVEMCVDKDIIGKMCRRSVSNERCVSREDDGARRGIALAAVEILP